MTAISRKILTVAVGAAFCGVLGCDETISSKEETKVRSDGQKVTETETVERKPDGTIEKEETKEVTPPAPRD